MYIILHTPKRLMLLLFLCVSCAAAVIVPRQAHKRSGHPECRWMCDDPICELTTRPRCAPPVCEIQCSVGSAAQCSPPRCETRCPYDQLPMDSCPTCETVCQPLVCPPSNVCNVLCEAPSCSWEPEQFCLARYPRCELQCEMVTCMYTPPPSSATQQHRYHLLVLLPLLYVFLL